MTSGTARLAGPDDIDRIVAILTTAFFHDPLWGPAFPDVDRRAEQAAGLWRFYVTCVQRYPNTYLTAGGEATAVWIPPGGVELTHDEEADLERLLLASTGRETTDTASYAIWLAASALLAMPALLAAIGRMT